MNKEDLQKILADHAEWLKYNTKGNHADLRRADLSNADLSNADLHDADLTDANLLNVTHYVGGRKVVFV